MSAYVLFFGGYKATRADIDVWSASAKAQQPDATFDGYPWPAGASSGAGSAVATFREAGWYRQALATIRECRTDRVYLVGHSSGCAIANAVDLGLTDTSRVTLVALDGFVPSRAQLARSSTQVWAAVCGKAKSMHHDSLKGLVGSRLKVYTASDSYDKWALHFSLVNSAANDKAVKSIATGYAGCRANLVWM